MNKGFGLGLSLYVLAGLFFVALGAFVAAASPRAVAHPGGSRPGSTPALQSAKRSVWEGVYSEEQAKRGQTMYQQECSGCHLADLLGDGIAPALVGSPFYFRWSDLSVGDMFNAVRTTMPQGAPASLSPRAYLDIISYLFKANKLPAGQSELPAEQLDLDQIMIMEKPPQP
jgi:mono/diheme cytochrome c family protein